MAMHRLLNALLFVHSFTISSSESHGDMTIETEWDVLVTTAFSFLDIPMNESSAINEGWTLLFNSECDDGTNQIIRGNVYWSNSDISSLPIFDADGHIAGLIIGVEDPGSSQQGKAPWIDYGTFFGLTAFFREPSTLCTPSDGTIRKCLWLSDGSKGGYYKVPLREKDIAGTVWKRGGCLDGAFRMGTHYWMYDQFDVNCDDANPFFTMYDDGKLHAFGVAMVSADRPFPNGQRWEQLPGPILATAFLPDRVPECIVEEDVDYPFTTMHVFMRQSVLDNPSECAVITQPYCNWNGCNGVVEGGDWCNLIEDRCVNGCGNGATWCLTATPAPTANGYCNWNGCDGMRQGSDWCNLNEERCAECGNGAIWCSVD